MNTWEMADETYMMDEPGADSEILLTANHPRSIERAIAWGEDVQACTRLLPPIGA